MAEEKEMWTIEELVAMTSEVQHKEVKWAGKALNVQWCELIEAEEPKMNLPDDEAPSEEQTEYYKEIAGKRVLAMIEKANDKEPDTASINATNWGSLPTTLRWNISSLVLGTANENFTIG